MGTCWRKSELESFYSQQMIKRLGRKIDSDWDFVFSLLISSCRQQAIQHRQTKNLLFIIFRSSHLSCTISRTIYCYIRNRFPANGKLGLQKGGCPPSSMVLLICQ